MADITGLDNLFENIDKLNSELAVALPEIAAAAAAPIHDEINMRIPRLTGDLARHLETTAARTTTKATAIVQIADSAPAGIEHKAVFLEYGTSKMPPEPFFRPGFEAGKTRGMAAAIQVIRGVVEK